MIKRLKTLNNISLNRKYFHISYRQCSKIFEGTQINAFDIALKILLNLEHYIIVHKLINYNSIGKKIKI